MQESVSFIKCLISGVWGGLSPAGCVPELWVGLLEIGAAGLGRLHPPLMFVELGCLCHQASQEEAAQRDFLGFCPAKPHLFPVSGSALEVF